jgi:ATP-dependent exoDNAse (exonuclease V) beta subunit
MLDLVNLLYVSMTRPEERLYILTRIPPKNQEDVASLPGFFQLFLQNQQLWVDGQARYEFGMKTVHVEKGRRKVTGTITRQNVISNDWRDKIEIRMRAPRVWDVENPDHKSQWGNRIHTLLSWITTGDDVEQAIEKACLAGLLDNQEQENVRQILLSVIRHPELERFFSGEVTVKTEAEILLPEGSFYRPDRVVFDKDNITILDYKSGRPNASHAEQLITYAGYIGEMGYHEVRRALVYLEPEVMVVEV